MINHNLVQKLFLCYDTYYIDRCSFFIDRSNSRNAKEDRRMQQIRKCVWAWIAQTAFFVLKLLYKIVGKKPADTETAAFLQFIKFGIVGVSNTVISYVLYTLSLLGFRQCGLLAGIDYFIAQVISFILSVLWSFYWNNKAVFVLQEGEQRSVWKALLKTYVSYSFTGLFLNSLLIWLWVDVVHISEFIAPLINLIISVPVNFIINKCWAFKGK